MTDNHIPTFTELLKGARLPEASHPVCLRADLVADFESAERELEALRKQPRPADSLDAGRSQTLLVNRIEELQRQMGDATYTFRLRALPKSKWRQLVAAYPPRKDDKGDPVPEDAQIGVNREDFLDALIRVSVTDPEMTEQDWAVFLDTITDRQYSDLSDEAWFLNRGEVSVPFSRAASLLKRDTASE